MYHFQSPEFCSKPNKLFKKKSSQSLFSMEPQLYVSSNSVEEEKRACTLFYFYILIEHFKLPHFDYDNYYHDTIGWFQCSIHTANHYRPIITARSI